ncbi:hypothetical protein DRE_02188 [Drechslerella stenobrocha 248]|uniref:Uncharacterized protein n=1 Tax=Drechslerella stenobrocha 248 TaxID=1043628 RepID=W7HY31_9PEZI|nr:hypothetical protein DRE_02188 [Drechslerella stenobrocha 248]
MGALDLLSSFTPQWLFGKPAETASAQPAVVPLPESAATTSVAGKPAPVIIDPVDPGIIDTPDLGGRLRQGKLLVASPYPDEDHLLDLDTLSRPNQLLAKALTIMVNRTAEYAVEEYQLAFNWDQVVDGVRKLSEREGYQYPRTEFYIIVFRSQLAFDADRKQLGELDKDAHLEAVESGQLLKYWFGRPHARTGRNLATCVWRHRDDAKKGGSGPGHIRAMEAVQGTYLELRVERLKLVIESHSTSWSIEKWTD